MDLVWLVYLIDSVTTKVMVISLVGMTVSAACITVAAVLYHDVHNGDEISRALLKFIKGSGLLLAVSIILSFVPSKDTAYKMLAAYGAQELAEMEEAKEVGGKAYEALNKILDGYLEEK